MRRGRVAVCLSDVIVDVIIDQCGYVEALCFFVVIGAQPAD